MYPYREMFYTLDDRVKKALFALYTNKNEKAMEILAVAREESIKIYENHSAPYLPDESNLPNEKIYSRKLRRKRSTIYKSKV